jgi:hypothetical protein
MICHTLTIVGAGEMSHKGFGMNTWLAIFLYVIVLVNLLNVILVSTELHLTIPIEIDIQNWVFLSSLIWAGLTIITHLYHIVDRIYLRRMYVRSQIRRMKSSII